MSSKYRQLGHSRSITICYDHQLPEDIFPLCHILETLHLHISLLGVQYKLIVERWNVTLVHIIQHDQTEVFKNENCKLLCKAL